MGVNGVMSDLQSSSLLPTCIQIAPKQDICLVFHRLIWLSKNSFKSAKKPAGMSQAGFSLYDL